jgi:toxin ParE1/3/4
LETGRPSFRVTRRAATDLRAIADYTLRSWGPRQRDAYLRALDRRFAWLADHPTLGRPRPDIRDGYHSYRQGTHVIFYLVRAGGIDIIGVLHQRMDVLSYFGQAER